MSDVKAAAERLRTIAGDNLFYWRSDSSARDCKILADAYLAEHPADDDEPITVEWMLDIGFELSRESIPFHGDIDGYFKYNERIKCWDWKLCPPATNLLGCFETRGQLLLLCRALGIELEERT